MLALGIILILLSAAALAGVLASGTDDSAALFGGSFELPTLVVFLAGALTLLVFIMGLELARSGVRRANENRRTRKRLRTLEEREGRGRDGDTPREPADDAGPSRRTSDVESERHDPGPPSGGDHRADGGTGSTPTTGG